MKIVYFDCFSGISGDMCLGALVSAGLSAEELASELKKLRIEGYDLRIERVKLNGICAINFWVETANSTQPARKLSDIEAVVFGSNLPEQVKNKTLAVFHCLARAEARVHGVSLENIHFHEVGALDAIIDVVGTILGLHLLGIERVFVSPLPMSRGFVSSLHGLLPSPAPATVEILAERRVPVYGMDITGELVTPTGAALAATLADSFGAMPSMVISQVGYGAGKREFEHPNLLRVIIGEILGYTSEVQDNNASSNRLAPEHHHCHFHGQESGERYFFN